MLLASLLALAVAVLHKDHHAQVLHHKASDEPADEATNATEPASNGTSSESDTEAEAANATETNATATPNAAMRCELLLDKSLDDIHNNGGIEAFANAAQSELAHAAEVEPLCVHILNLRGKYDQGMDALNLMQLVKHFLRKDGTKVVVDFEILPECKASYGTAVEKVQSKLANETSALRTGWLHTFLSSHSKVVKGHGASDKWMKDTTMSTKPVEEPTSAAAAAILIAFFAAQA